jgi:putative FmdB family regulatory protein
MPLYEYVCDDCHRQSELLVKNLESRPACPECGSKKMSKLLSVIGSPVVGEGKSSSGRSDAETCGRPQCARGCMFDN